MQPEHKCVLLQLVEFPECSNIAGNFIRQISFKLLKAIATASASASKQFGQAAPADSVVAMPERVGYRSIYSLPIMAF